MTTLTDTLLGQWQASPRFRAIVTDILQPILDNGLDVFRRIELMRDIDEAEGVWLDYLGVLVGVRRPATTDPTLDDRFGFTEAGEQFDVAPFRGSTANAAVYPLPDATFRRFVKARAIMVLGDGTIRTFTDAVHEIDGSAVVVDNRDMSVTITTAMRPLVELADNIGALPRTAGVRVIYP